MFLGAPDFYLLAVTEIIMADNRIKLHEAPLQKLNQSSHLIHNLSARYPCTTQLPSTQHVPPIPFSA
jgi:hypothetical protein